MWTVSPDHVPPLVTASNLNVAQLIALGGTPGFRPGAIGQPGTATLLEGGLDSPELAGGRFTVGFGNLFNCGLGMEATFFFLGTRGNHNDFSSDNTGFPGLFSPFVDANGTPNALAVAFPTLTKGNIDVSNTTRMWGMEANVRKALFCDCDHKLDLLVGFRFIELTENLTISRFSECIMPGCNNVTTDVVDSFGTRNRFYGGQVGFDYEFHMARWILGLNGKVAIGDMHETVTASGLTVASPGANVASSNTGLLVQASNSGRQTTDHFAVVPEVGVKVGYQITDNLSAYVGYSVLYMSNVVRPGEQVDLVVDKTGTLHRPSIPLNNTSFWAHGWNAGLEWKY
jgi:hypothetical protein